jgi:hypothetical protein
MLEEYLIAVTVRDLEHLYRGCMSYIQKVPDSGG